MGLQFMQGIDLLSSTRYPDNLSFFPQKLSSDGADSCQSNDTTTPVSTTTTSPPLTDTLMLGQGTKTDETFSAMIYSAQMEKVSLAVQFQQVAAQTDAASQTSEATKEAATRSQGQQLTFSFFTETRQEELMTFQQRTSAVADNLSGTTKQTYIEASQSVSTRFHMSLDISGETLQSFANGSETLSGDYGLSFNTFMQIVQQALGLEDDTVNQFFQMINGYMSGADKFGTNFNKFIDDLFNALFQDSDKRQNQGNNTTSSTQSLQSVQLHFEFDFQFQSTQSIQIATQAVQQSDPITLDLDGDGIELTSYKEGARFDITGKGYQATTAFVTGGDAFLAIDRNNDGQINSGKELFGDQHGAVNGYAELAKFDSNSDGVINAQDKNFDKLLLFRDNGDGKTDSGELVSLKDAGIVELNVRYTNVMQKASGGNQIKQVSTYKRANGQTGNTADAILNYIA